MTQRRLIALAVVALAGLGGTALADPLPGQQEKRSSTTVHGVVHRLVVDVDFGAIDVRVGRVTRVDATKTWLLEEPTLQVRLDRGVLTVKARCPNTLDTPVFFVGPLTGCGTDVVVTVPSPRLAAQLVTHGGGVAVSGLRGDLDVRAGTGRVVVRDVQGARTAVRTDGGAVSLADVRTGRLEVASSTGDTALSRVRASTASLRTDGGDVTVDRLQAPRLDVRSSTGSTTVTGSRVAGLRLTTDGGDVTVARTVFTTADVVSSTGSTAVDTASRPGAVRVRTDGGRADVVVPSGRYDVTTSTSGGSVSVEGVVVDPGADALIDISSSTGDITIRGR